MKYKHSIDNAKKYRRWKFFIILIALIIFLSACLILAAVIDSIINKNLNHFTTSSAKTTNYQAKEGVYESQYFTFQADKSWKDVPTESTADKFVYRSYNKEIILSELTIFINHDPKVQANRLLPVSYKPNGLLQPGTISPHCIEAMPNKKPQAKKTIIFHQVKFECSSDSTQYEVLVGVAGAGTMLEMVRPSGEKINYAIYYKNVTAAPEPSQLYKVIATFQTR